MLGPVALAAVADTFREGRGERMGWYSSATMVGRFLAPTVGGLLIPSTSLRTGFVQDFRWVYLGCSAAGLLALLAALQLPWLGQVAQPKGPGARWATMRRELHLILTNRSLLLTSGVEAMQYFAFGAVETFLPLYLPGADRGVLPGCPRRGATGSRIHHL